MTSVRTATYAEGESPQIQLWRTSSRPTTPTIGQARNEDERFKRFPYDELMARVKASLDIFWLRDESLEMWEPASACCYRRGDR